MPKEGIFVKVITGGVIRPGDGISPSDITISVGPTSLMEEIQTWQDLYGIDERYKAKICCENDGKYWLEQVFGEWQEKGESPDEFMKTLSRNALKKPFADNNFLKKAFLEGCVRAELFTP